MSAAISSMHIRGRAGLAVNKPVEPGPAGWMWVALNNVARQETGHTPSRSHPEWWGGDIPWIGIRDARLHHGGVIYDTLQTTNPLGLANSSARLLPKGTVCLSRTASVGYVTIMGREMATSQDFVTWTCSEALLPEFLVKALIAEGEGLRKFGKGTTHTTIYFPEIRALHICLPPLAEQRRIVAKLDALNATSVRARTELARIETLVSRYKQAVLGKAFSGELTPRQGGKAATRLNHKIAAQIDGRSPELPAIPATWSWAALSSVAEVSGGLTKNSKRDSLPLHVPYLRVANVYANELRLDDVSVIGCTENEVARTRLMAGDLLLVEGNGSLDQIGRVALWSGELDHCVHQNHLIKVRPCGGLDSKFALYWLLSPLGRRAIEAVAASSSGLHTLSLSKVGGLPLPLCNLQEQHEIVRRIEAAFARIDRLAGEARRALELVGRLDEAILARAFRGELVPQDENDEPADRQLERIRAERAATPKAKRGRRAKA